MGRWAQARRTGGDQVGIPILMIFAEITDTQEITITFNRDFDIGDAVPQWQSNPSAEESAAIVQLDARTLEVGFAGAVTGDTTVIVTDADGLLVQGQEIAIT